MPPVPGPDTPLVVEDEDEEALETGSVSWRSYLVFIRARGFLLTAVMVVFYVFYAGLNIGSNVWLSIWSDDKVLQNATHNITPVRARSCTDYYMGYYGMFGGLQIFFITGFAVTETVSSLDFLRLRRDSF